MCTARELEDGTYNLDDVLDMVTRILWKADQVRKARERAEAEAQANAQWNGYR